MTLITVERGLRYPLTLSWLLHSSLFFRRLGMDQDSRTVGSCSLQALYGKEVPREGACQLLKVSITILYAAALKNQSAPAKSRYY